MGVVAIRHTSARLIDVTCNLYLNDVFRVIIIIVIFIIGVSRVQGTLAGFMFDVGVTRFEGLLRSLVSLHLLICARSL